MAEAAFIRALLCRLKALVVIVHYAPPMQNGVNKICGHAGCSLGEIPAELLVLAP
jgi:hypothetical protein